MMSIKRYTHQYIEEKYDPYTFSETTDYGYIVRIITYFEAFYWKYATFRKQPATYEYQLAVCVE